jgi:ParB family chromosome partitioning protein
MSISHQVLQQVSLNLLTPHPRNAIIYGANEDVSDLVELISESGWVEPLVVTPNYLIVSGHRRWRACQILGKQNIPVVFRDFPDEIAMLKALLLENASRNKTIEQRIREGMAWELIEQEKARHRQGTRTDLRNIPEKFPECSRGDSRDVIAKRIGFSGRSYSKARNIIERIDSEVKEGSDLSVQVLRSALSKSIDAAHQLLHKSAAEHTEIAELIEKGKARSVTAAIRLLKKSNHSGEQLKPLTNCSSYSPQLTKTQSCWNCQHRLESVSNQSIYCNKFGILNLTYKSGDERGQECLEWTDRSEPLETLKKETFVLKLFLPAQWQDWLEATAASLGIDAATWVTNLIGASLFPSSDFGERSDDNAKLAISEDMAVVKHPEKKQENTF